MVTLIRQVAIVKTKTWNKSPALFTVLPFLNTRLQINAATYLFNEFSVFSLILLEVNARIGMIASMLKSPKDNFMYEIRVQVKTIQEIQIQPLPFLLVVFYEVYLELVAIFVFFSSHV